MDAAITRHRIACDGFARVAHAVPPDRWAAPTPCTEWNARDVLEHVIGFHEVLLLRPLDRSPRRPRDDVPARWDATASAIFAALTTTEGRETAQPFLAALTTDVLVHTWDLARAVGIDPQLDTDLCARAYAQATSSEFPRTLFADAVVVAGDADTTTQLIAFYGRDPSWR